MLFTNDDEWKEVKEVFLKKIKIFATFFFFSFFPLFDDGWKKQIYIKRIILFKKRREKEEKENRPIALGKKKKK